MRYLVFVELTYTADQDIPDHVRGTLASAISARAGRSIDELRLDCYSRNALTIVGVLAEDHMMRPPQVVTMVDELVMQSVMETGFLEEFDTSSRSPGACLLIGGEPEITATGRLRRKLNDILLRRLQ